MAKRGAPRKNGARKPCGRLRVVMDQGSEGTLLHRTALVGARDATNSMAGYWLGVLLISDPPEITREQHDAGLRYALLHSIAFGSSTPRSHLAQFESVLGANSLYSEHHREEQKAWAEADLRDAAAYLLIDGKAPFDMLQTVTIEAATPTEDYSLNRRQLEALRTALSRLITLWKTPRDQRSSYRRF